MEAKVLKNLSSGPKTTEGLKITELLKAVWICCSPSKAKIIEKQKVESTTDESQDIINYFILGDEAFFNLFQVRNGKLIEQENFRICL